MPDSAAADPGNPAPEESSPPLSSATTNEAPAFGWSSYAERINGRFAMVGILVIAALELCTGSTVIHWLGLG
ncbi:MAG: high light inducible protein [Synechococcus sp. SB0668_bin_15]|nr:high light inducible protein [Synechococcus sp. SB0668_bin_15]MXZ83037.1 high light inducible protein [Synechococcus sp. SB0666_bin_14]MYA90707.1 high light inducible protein [Synechococcus sp. SB0663_bin_10]MYC49010.1 high light inducible protein [Synechococcus sp. SB0662_bin_14]MYG45800.1 high light inducible protein [Synechococcus sp. SB0675_bin_6]MYJ59781.1 high light inducible protein [Synechococcus sp. SB0672_bin_6]MYK91692.1 high light inducible protein [Synechococcus sp. SB0669_bin